MQANVDCFVYKVRRHLIVCNIYMQLKCVCTYHIHVCVYIVCCRLNDYDGPTLNCRIKVN